MSPIWSATSPCGPDIGVFRRYSSIRPVVGSIWPSRFAICPVYQIVPSFWWNRFGRMFAAEIRKKRVAHMRFYPQWRWHLDEAFVKVNGKLCYLWRAFLESVVTAKRDEAAALKFLKRIIAHHEEIRPTADRRHRRA